MSRSRLDIAVAHIQFARDYTNILLENLDDDEWFTIPDGCITNIAWQVGHLAMAEYALTLIRVRGKEPDDTEFISSRFFKRYKKTSVASADPSENEPLDVIRQTLGAVHEQAMRELSEYTDDQLSEKLPAPYEVFESKLGSVFFCGSHEMLHAGQIGLIRRMLGKQPVR